MKGKYAIFMTVVLVVALFSAIPAAAAEAAPPPARGQTGLSQAETEGLLYMREEEKLAHDVYVALYQRWKLAVFSNISSAETNHMAAVKTLLDRYGLPDPAAGNPPGVFDDPFLQALYDDLMARGNQSVSEALKVGGAIEEIDILDIEEYLAAAAHRDIHNVYNNLVDGSCNHLRAFVSTLKRQTGETYQPQYLSQEVFQAILNGTY